MIKRKKILTVLILLSCIGIFFGAPKYKASTSFYSEYKKIPSSSSLSFFDQIISGKGQLSFNIENLLESDQFLSEMVNTRFIINEQESSLADHWFNREESTFNPITYIKKLDISLHLKPNITKDELNQYKAKEKLKEMLKYDEDRKTGLHILSVVVKKYPDLSIQIIEQAYNSIVLYANKVTNTKAREKKKFIESRLITIKSDLVQSEGELVDFIVENRSFSQSPLLSLKKERLERDIALQSQLFIRLSDELELAKIDEKDNTSSIFLLQEPHVSTKKAGGNALINLIRAAITYSFFVFIFEAFLNRKKLFSF
ncbi:MAG: hypothetical protein CMC33_00995 [Flavobacteriaceae bacterium]|nr:hypothetical protein [Flavobacteriaceae bacterium]